MIYKKDVPVILPKDIFIGHPKAPVTLMEYGDYECETGLHTDLIVREVLQRFPGMVNFNYRHFPQLRIHQRAHKAAEAAIAAAQAGGLPPAPATTPLQPPTLAPPRRPFHPPRAGA